jgi:hypothetical protein
MRVLIIGVLACSMAAGACNRAEAPAVAQTTPSAASPASADSSGVPVATAGRTDSAKADAVRTPAFREVTIPAGTQLAIVLDTPVGSATSRVEQAVHAHLSRPIVVQGQTVVAEGSGVSGVVTDATRSGKVKGRAHLAVRFNTLTPRGDDERYSIQTSAVGRTAAATKKRDAMEIGIPAAGGAVVGGLIGGKKGAVIGGAAAGGAGTAVVLNQRGKEVNLGKGAPLTLRLAAPVTIRVRS